MNPLELEILFHFLYSINLDPKSFEYCLWVDGDTEVYPTALSSLISHMSRDTMIAGICGETLLRNENESWITMIQVYEYFISHHLSKTFESLFNSVTCLPGCFCLYRLYCPALEKPILASPAVVNLYGTEPLNTLHLKNLLQLGEVWQ